MKHINTFDLHKHIRGISKEDIFQKEEILEIRDVVDSWKDELSFHLDEFIRRRGSMFINPTDGVRHKKREK